MGREEVDRLNVDGRWLYGEIEGGEMGDQKSKMEIWKRINETRWSDECFVKLVGLFVGTTSSHPYCKIYVTKSFRKEIKKKSICDVKALHERGGELGRAGRGRCGCGCGLGGL